MEPTDRTCRWVSRRLSLLVGAELIGADRRRVERHLIGCDLCRERRDAAARSLALLHLAREPHPPDGSPADAPSLWPALARQIRESRRTAGTQPAWSRPFNENWARLALAASVLIAGGGVGLGLGWRRTPHPVAVVQAVKFWAADPPVAPARPGSALPPEADPLDSFRFGINPLELGVGPALPPSGPKLAIGPRDYALTKPAVDPFQPPATLRLDFDLDQGTVTPPTGRDSQRAY